ncbi:MAG: PTS sugar transporter subunit IIA [Desulfobulbus sp.]|nr:MAG: PTS sugar transporter subunit IIA [Desulfobulbus sp.]
MLQLKKQCVLLELEASDKESVLQEMAIAVHQCCSAINLETLKTILSEREQIGSTGVGNGVAIPHGKIPGLDKLLLCFARSSAGISFDAIDNRPVHLFVMILSPVNLATDYLQTLARVSRLLKDNTTRHKLLQATDAETIKELFNRKNVKDK